jgi:alkanesulfonate monooxygenase SsuD/methylene tetrahydromethanopterin reductase-like flavin-dependent oxidoreductase (luciferase family)
MARVKIGVTLKMYDYSTYEPKRLADIVDQARRAEDLGFDSVWVMDHFLIQRAGRRVLGHDPMVCLAAVAAATTRVAVGSMVLCHAFRHAGQLARESATLADLSGGRFVLGLGTGWHRPEFDAFGLPFDHRVGRLEEALEPLRRLLRGERASCNGAWLHLDEASIAVTGAPPPLWVAASGPRMLKLAATADGWNHSYWGGDDTGPFKAALAGLDRALAAIGRERSELTVSASVACVPGGWVELHGGFREPEVAVGPPEQLAETVSDYAEAGAQHVILSLSPDPYAELDPALLESAGRVVRLVG